MFTPRRYLKDPTDTRLSKVLRECRTESDKAYKISLNIFDALSQSLNLSKKEIRKGCQAIDQYTYSDNSIGSIASALKNQLSSIEHDLQSDVEHALSDLRIKRQHDSNFNITLFGRTMVGKSTLMAILTHANEGAIGNGAQRTTRDVREYEWNGMCITDVPGIDAFGGKEDDATSENAAKNADLIIFMISSGQPESSEADWLIKLKKEDKAILCLCNYKKALQNKTILRLKLKNKAAFIAEMNLDGLKKQFNDLLRTELPNEHIDIYVAMLLAEQMAQQPEYSALRHDLLEVSCFSEFKKAIIAQISSRGIFYRRKSYLSLIDAPIYRHYLKLGQFANDTYSGWLSVHQKQEEFKDWQREFNRAEKNSLRNRIENIFGEVNDSIASFVETNVERNDVKERWARHIERFNLDTKIENALTTSFNRCQNKINDLFKDLGTELKMVNKLANFNSVRGDGSITNWKRFWGWGSAAAGIGSVIGFVLLNSNPIGWIFTGIGLLFGLFSFFSSSREDKLRDARRKMYSSLSDSLAKAKEKAIGQAMKEFDKNICSGMQKTAFSRLCMIQTTLLTVLNVERRCAMEYCNHHTEISLQLVKNVLSYDTVNPVNRYIKIDKVARIPGKKIVIVTDNMIEGVTRRFISGWMGSNEYVEVISLKTELPTSSQLSYLARKYLPNIHLRLQRIKNKEEVIYAPKVAYSQEQLDGMDIIQQILNIPIILTNT